MIYLTNAFSLNMLTTAAATIQISPLSKTHVARLLRDTPSDQLTHAIGHESTALLLSNLLDYPVPVSRTTVTLTSADELIVAQYKGPRLPEGATTLPEGATIEFLRVGHLDT